MYKKVYINLDNVWVDVSKEIEEFMFLKEEDDVETIWYNFRMKLEKNRPEWEKYMISVFSLELFLFLRHLRNEWYTMDQIEILRDRPMFIYNDDLFEIRNGRWMKMDTDNVGFFAIRWGNWGYPFFFLLKRLIGKKWWKVMKTNDIKRNIIWKGKFYALETLYEDRGRLIWDIVTPYKISPQHYPIFLDFLSKKMWWKIVLKKDNTQLWQWVFVVDLENFDADQSAKFTRVMKTHKEFGKEVYLMPFDQFEEEYRVYFTKFHDKVKIHSLKRKFVTTPVEDIVKADSFEYYTNVMLKWEYIENKEWQGEGKRYSQLIETSKEYVEKMDYTTGALEFGKTLDGRLVFFEVNSMADPITYQGEDMGNMQWFYEDIFNHIIEQ